MRLPVWILVLAACEYTAPQEQNGPTDGGMDSTPLPDDPPPITCGDLQCSGNATCDPAGPTCECNAGFTGDGMTCDDIDECANANGGCASICVNSSGTFACANPTTCAEVKTLLPDAVDGPFTLFLDGDTSKPWVAHCAKMATAPTEYLTAIATGMYNAGGASPGTDVITTYSKLQIQLSPLGIKISGRDFAESTGMLDHSGDGMIVRSMPAGVAMDCVGNNSNSGMATVDLRNTPFAMSAASFSEGGSQPDHTISLTSSDRLLSITGGGFCGWYGPSEANQNPFNNNVQQAVLPISYSP